MYRRQGSRPSQEKEMQNSKMAVWGGLTNSCEKKRSKKKRRNVKIYLFECSFKEQQGEIRKPSSVIIVKKKMKTIEWARLKISSSLVGYIVHGVSKSHTQLS